MRERQCERTFFRRGLPVADLEKGRMGHSFTGAVAEGMCPEVGPPCLRIKAPCSPKLHECSNRRILGLGQPRSSSDSSGTRFLLAACLGTGFSACTFAGVAKGTAAAKKIRTHQSLLLYSLLPEFPSLMSLPVSG